MSSADRVELYRAGDGWRWRALAGNGEIVAQGEAHTRMRDAMRAARAVFPDVPVVEPPDDDEVEGVPA